MPKSNRPLDPTLVVTVYFLFFLSGAAALVYQVVWVRSLSLIFGGTHLAVTTVLSVFMGGLALGSYVIGRYGDRIRDPLRLYGVLELGIAIFALLFAVLVEIYPAVYVPLARGVGDSRLSLSVIRVVFTVIVLIGPTTFMGGTLPVLSRFVSGRHGSLAGHLSLLYGLNTLGAVLGTLAAGFVLLRAFSVSTSLAVAVATNVAVGLASFALARRFPWVEPGEATHEPALVNSAVAETPDFPPALSFRLVLFGIAVSGFCALGYEVLWTRVLSIVVGASVYGFTVMLAAFLTGIALGSKAYGLIVRWRGEDRVSLSWSVAGFGVVEIIIGVTALLITFYLRDLPSHSLGIKSFFAVLVENSFESRQWANLSLAFLYMLIPAFFMGVAFPLAGTINGANRRFTSGAVGEVLAYNTVGAILGAAVSGYVLTFFFSIEQSLQMLAAVNIGLGAAVLVTFRSRGPLVWGTGVASVLLIALIALRPEMFSSWDRDYFAIFRANQPEAFRTPQMVLEAIENTEVLYFAEGVEAIVSSIKIKGGGNQAFITNGRIEASTLYWDQQVQYTLGHLPMLLNRDPKKVLVVGLGSGMTLGATSVHPELDRLTLVELEPEMLHVARTFGEYNHRVLDHPKLEIVFNDGRNFLLTTRDRFDVITADPIHPWFRGAGYLYTREYFKLASERLAEGGVMCQWLPIYELTPENLRSVVRTFRTAFPYTMLWLTYYDSVIVGSNTPLRPDPLELDRRIAVPAVHDDLERVFMGSARDLLSYFALGSQGMEAFGRNGVLNTDDNLYLEFSAPLSMGKAYLMKGNVLEIVPHRESIVDYLDSPPGTDTDEVQLGGWRGLDEAARLYDPLHAVFLGGDLSAQFLRGLSELETAHPAYGPGRFLRREYEIQNSREPRLLAQTPELLLTDPYGETGIVISAVFSPVSDQRGYVMFVDNDARAIYGSLLVADRLDDRVSGFVQETMTDLQAAYLEQARSARAEGRRLPDETTMKQRIQAVVEAGVSEAERSWAAAR